MTLQHDHPTLFSSGVLTPFPPIFGIPPLDPPLKNQKSETFLNKLMFFIVHLKSELYVSFSFLLNYIYYMMIQISFYDLIIMGL